MISATIVLGQKMAKHEYDSVESTKKALAETSTLSGGQVILRCPDDETFLGMSAACAEIEGRAEEGVKLVAGSERPFWHVASIFADGAGWRMVLVGMKKVPVSAQAHPGLRPGMLNSRG